MFLAFWPFGLWGLLGLLAFGDFLTFLAFLAFLAFGDFWPFWPFLVWAIVLASISKFGQFFSQSSGHPVANIHHCRINKTKVDSCLIKRVAGTIKLFTSGAPFALMVGS
jgi:hypothetical protein